MKRLQHAGCRDFFVATWAEAEALMPWPGDLDLSVLHGVGRQDLNACAGRRGPGRCSTRPSRSSAGATPAGPATSWSIPASTGSDVAAADVKAGLLEGLKIETLMSHLACADEDVAMNEAQRDAFAALAARVTAKRASLANSAGICLGRDYAFDLMRPGLALYGGIPRREAEGHIRQVARVEAEILQRRRIEAGASVGYNATFTAERAHELAIVNLGYGDGYLRGFLGHRPGEDRRRLRPGRRARVDGPHRDLRRFGAAAQGRRLARARLRPADRVGAVRPLPVRAADQPRRAVRTDLDN